MYMTSSRCINETVTESQQIANASPFSEKMVFQGASRLEKPSFRGFVPRSAQHKTPFAMFEGCRPCNIAVPDIPQTAVIEFTLE
jgi:hypothetical protein